LHIKIALSNKIFIGAGVCPMEKDSGMSMSSVVINVHMYRWEGEKKGGNGGRAREQKWGS
jgi:hypothetical protein